MTEAVRVNVQRVSPQASSLEADIERADFVAKLMDAQFDVAGVKFGLDALIGLIPVAGDVVSTAIGLYPLIIARKHKLGRVVIARMAMNLGVDFLVGAIPLVGDAFDVVMRANLKNVELLKKAVAKRQLR